MLIQRLKKVNEVIENCLQRHESGGIYSHPYGLKIRFQSRRGPHLEEVISVSKMLPRRGLENGSENINLIVEMIIVALEELRRQ